MMPTCRRGVSYSLVSGPSGLTVGAGGLVSWTPTEVQGPGEYEVTVQVRDNGEPPLGDMKGFRITVREVNTAPVLSAVADRVIDEQVPWSVQLTASDADLPAQVLSYSLVSGPSGLTVGAGGLVSWAPTEAQGPGEYEVAVQVRDNGEPPLGNTTGFRITVREINTAPVLSAVPDQAIDGQESWSLQLTASDADLPPQVLTYSLVEGPSGLTVEAGGRVSWTPGQLQRSGEYEVVVRVTDNAEPPLSSTARFRIAVLDGNNTPPVLSSLADEAIDEQVPWSVQLTASDADLPAQVLSYSLVSGPSGLTVGAGGLVSWTPTEVQGPGEYEVTVQVRDNGEPPLSNTKGFRITVREVNTAPVLTAVADRVIDEQVPWSVQLTASDADLPAQVLSYSLVSGPSGLTVGAGGLVSWTPTGTGPRD
ncbi:MAG: putative Ig domain-containing protein [Verrucomicrobiae bacterium]|nr:putative Ig domain-containing protein [Verrucomicrobiae bacterium]